MESAQEVFAGFTPAAGPEGGGTAFSINSYGTNFTLLHTFRKLGFTPTGNLIQARDGLLYGMTSLIHSLQGPTQGRESLGSLVLLRNGAGEGEFGEED